MRITTRMLNQMATKTGLPLQKNSLLNYINNSEPGSTFSAAQQIQKVTGKRQIESYESLSDSAKDLTQAADILSGEEEDSLFAKAEAEGKTTELVTQMEEMAEAYNSTLKSLSSQTGVLEDFYLDQLKTVVSEHKEALEKIGITAGKSGELKVDKKVLSKAAFADLKAAFGKEGEVSEKLSYLGSRIRKNSSAYVESLSSQYSSKGSSRLNSSAYRTGSFNYLR